MKNLAIIPARSGSKGIPNKNIKLLNGVPLIAYTIKAALDSGMYDRVMVSTDSEEYAEIARAWGAEVPFLRSPETSTDKSSSWSVVKEVLDNYAQMGETFDTLTLLQATSPLRTGKHIQEAFQLLEEKNAEAVVAVNETGTPMERLRHLEPELRLGAFAEKPHVYHPRQSFLPTYQVNGAIYLWRTEKFSLDATIYTDAAVGYEMSRNYAFDIDDQDDFLLAEAIINTFPEFQNYFSK